MTQVSMSFKIQHFYLQTGIYCVIGTLFIPSCYILFNRFDYKQQFYYINAVNIKNIYI